jgi:hypothetical protein
MWKDGTARGVPRWLKNLDIDPGLHQFATEERDQRISLSFLFLLGECNSKRQDGFAHLELKKNTCKPI